MSPSARPVEEVARELPPTPASVSEARRVVDDLLDDAGRMDLQEAARLLVSEVVTNALIHAGTSIRLDARVDAEGLRVEVSDGSVHQPVRRRPAAGGNTGRGIVILESLADDWGVVPVEGRKTVWFVLSSGEMGTATLEMPQRRQSVSAGDDVVVVELRNVPLLLHIAFQTHATMLLREYLLASVDTRDEAKAIHAHAAASDAMALLEEHLPRPALSLDIGDVLIHTSEPAASLPMCMLPVPAASVPSFAALGETMDVALEMSREGRIFTPRTQRELRDFREWVCNQVAAQVGGGRPSPWALRLEPPEAARPPFDWTPLATTTGVASRVVVDPDNRILDVGPGVVALLGYDDHSELVGQRLIKLIPERFRQGHVAGFTMYLLLGRGPLIGRPVRVPVLCRDGTEVDVRLLIDVDRLPDGMPLFVAEMIPLPDAT